MSAISEKSQGALLLDGRTRALVSRNDPFQVAGAYEWAKRIKALPRFQSVSLEALLRAAVVIAEVRTPSSLPLGHNLRQSGVGERHVRRLLASLPGEDGDLAYQMQRIVRLLHRTANVEDLVANLVFWGDRTRRRVAMDYYRAVYEDAA